MDGIAAAREALRIDDLMIDTISEQLAAAGNNEGAAATATAAATINAVASGLRVSRGCFGVAVQPKHSVMSQPLIIFRAPFSPATAAAGDQQSGGTRGSTFGGQSEHLLRGVVSTPSTPTSGVSSTTLASQLRQDATVSAAERRGRPGGRGEGDGGATRLTRTYYVSPRLDLTSHPILPSWSQSSERRGIGVRETSR